MNRKMHTSNAQAEASCRPARFLSKSRCRPRAGLQPRPERMYVGDASPLKYPSTSRYPTQSMRSASFLSGLCSSTSGSCQRHATHVEVRRVALIDNTFTERTQPASAQLVQAGAAGLCAARQLQDMQLHKGAWQHQHQHQLHPAGHVHERHGTKRTACTEENDNRAQSCAQMQRI